MSRRHAEDPEFGSDSFLDIIANIVGILIILIVIAGVKVARQPPPSAETAVESEVTEPKVTVAANQAADDGDQRIAQTVSGQQMELLTEEQERVRVRTAELRRQLMNVRTQADETAEQAALIQQQVGETRDQITGVRVDLANVQQGQDTAGADAEEVRAFMQSVEQQTAAAIADQQMIAESTSRVYRRQETANQELEEISLATRQLKELLDQQQATEAKNVSRLEHRLSPVARSESDQEMHFRLSNGHISWVPIEPLLEQLKRQVLNRGSLIRRFGKYQGICGPVNGYVMKYTVERVIPSPLDGLNGVPTGFRIGVSRWTVTPSDSLRAESVDSALKFGSRFRQVAEAADPDATMTIWLYAADFKHFRRLREFGHGLGLRIAARPLPDGSEITGSPAGSRSSAQ